MVISDYFVKLGVDSFDCQGPATPPPPPFLNYETKISVNGDDGWDCINTADLQLLHYANLVSSPPHLPSLLPHKQIKTSSQQKMHSSEKGKKSCSNFRCV